MTRSPHAAPLTRIAPRLAALAPRVAALAPLLLAGVILTTPPAAHAQSMEPGQNHIMQPETEVIALDFAGGTVADYIEAIKEAMKPTASNILVRGEAGAVPMGPVTLEGVPLANALRLLEGDIQVGANAFNIDVNTLEWSAGRPAYAVDVRLLGTAGRNAGRLEILVLSLKEITTALPGDPPEAVVPAETVLTAIETALAVASGEAGEARVQYHEESGLLVMAGSDRALRAADQVIEAIAGDVHARRVRMRDLSRSQNLTNPDMLEERLADARVAAEMAEVQMGRARTHMEITQQQIVEVEKRVKEGVASTNELREFHMRLSDTQTEMLERQIMVKRAKQSVEHAEVKLERALRLVAGTGAPGDRAEALRKENAMLLAKIEMRRAENEIFRERLVILEAQLATLKAERKTNNAPGGRGGRGGDR